MKILRSKDHIYTVDGIPKTSVTQNLSENGFSDFSFVNPAVLARAQQFGLAVHYVGELYNKGELKKIEAIFAYDKRNEAMRPYLNAWILYFKEWKVEPLEVEPMYYSKVWDYCGNPDLVCREKGILTIDDIKTATVLQPSMGLQLGGYKILHDENSKSKVKNRNVIQLKGDGTYVRKSYNQTEYMNVYKNMISTRAWKVRNGYIKKEI